MLNITVLCVGKLKESFYIAAVREYEKRLKGYCKLTLLELPEEKAAQRPLPGTDQRRTGKGGTGHLCQAPQAGDPSGSVH